MAMGEFVYLNVMLVTLQEMRNENGIVHRHSCILQQEGNCQMCVVFLHILENASSVFLHCSVLDVCTAPQK